MPSVANLMHLLPPTPWFSGIWPVLPTPLAPSEAVDLTSLRNVVGWLVARGVAGLWVLGEGAEVSNLDAASREQIVDEVVATVDGAIPIVAGASPGGPADLIATVRKLATAGVRAASISEPVEIPHNPAELGALFKRVAESSPIPIVPYIHLDRWQRTGASLPDVTEELAAMLSHQNLAGAKFAAPDFRAWLQVTTGIGPVGKPVLTSSGRLLLAAAMGGGLGGVFDDATVLPSPYVDLWALIREGSYSSAITLQKRLMPLGEAISRRPHFGAKYALSQMGLCSDRMSGALGTLDAQTRLDIDRHLADLTDWTSPTGVTDL